MKLSPFGKIVKVCSETINEVKEEFDWCDALCDAAILSAISFFATIGGTTVVGVTGLNVLYAGCIAAGSQFFTVLALKRKLIKEN